MLYLTSFIAGHFGYGFRVLDFKSAVLGSLIISVASWFLSMFIRDDKD
jgi:uncharacterized membrane protein YvlD (DUF360 family)